MFRKQTALFEDPLITYPIYDLKLDFKDYISQCKQIVTQHRLDLNENAEKIVQANCPVEYRPATTSKPQIGVLLIHGLFDSPFIMNDIAKQLSAQGLLARSILLPGHGTVPGALLNITCEDWIQSIRYGLASFQNEVQKVFLVGYSIGGALSCYLSMQASPIPIAGLVLLAPAFEIRSRWLWLAKLINKWNHLYPLDSTKWLVRNKENDYARYRSIAFSTICQADRLIKMITGPLSCPQLYALPLNDKTVNSQATINFFLKQTQVNNQMILYSNKKIDSDDSRLIIRSSRYPAQNILDISHIGLPIAPTNSHYGKSGDYNLTDDYNNKAIQYDEIDSIEFLIYKMLYKLKLTPYQRKRSTFNPDFDYLIQSINKFIFS